MQCVGERPGPPGGGPFRDANVAGIRVCRCLWGRVLRNWSGKYLPSCIQGQHNSCLTP